MKADPANVEGKIVESHEFAHSVEHQVNWSHFLFALVILVALWKLGPAVSAAAGADSRDDRS
jgi:hypothetical protein